jgi:hypothetical protein
VSVKKETGEEEDEIVILLKDPRNNPILEMRMLELGRLYFTRRCTVFID